MRIIKKYIFIILLFISLSVFAHDAIKIVPDILFHKYKGFSFESLPKPDSVKLRSIIPKLESFVGYADAFERITLLDDPECPVDITEGYRIYDFTGDGIEDIAYNGYSGAESDVFVIWRNKNKKFEKVGVDWGNVTKVFLESDDSKIYSFAIITGFCCAGTIGDIVNFSAVSTENKLLYWGKNTHRFFINTSFPSGYEIISKKRFQVTTDSCFFRSGPIINNNYDAILSTEDMPVYGNIIAKLEQGGTGTAYAKFKDGLGNFWWFVALDRDAKAYYNLFYGDKWAYKCGWIQNKFLEFVK